jgi:uncharacterized protein YbjQ (UPF0145 family)
MANNKNAPDAFINSLISTGDDLPPMEPQSPSEDLQMAEVSLENPTNDFAESNAVFADLQNFGQTGVMAEPAPAENFLEEKPQKLAPAPRKELRLPVSTDGAAIPMTMSDTLPGWRIEKYLGLVSASTPLDPQSADPIADASDRLTQNAQAKGAAAIVSIRVQVLPDNTLLILGTAVVASPE